MAEKTVAIIGASNDRAKFGNKSVRAHQAQGWTVYPVNPNAREIEGLAAYASVRDVPRPVRRVSLYVPPSVGVKLMGEVAEVQPEELFLNPGADDERVEQRARELGIDPIIGCSIVDLGVSPSEFPDR